MVILDMTRKLSYFNLPHLIGVNLYPTTYVRILKLVIMFTVTLSISTEFKLIFLNCIIIWFRGLWTILTLL